MSAGASRLGAEPGVVARWLIVGVVGLVFAIPIVSMIVFTLKEPTGGYTVDNWLGLFDPENARKYQNLFTGVVNSLVLAVVTVAIMLVFLVPTMILVQLQFPKLRRVLEFICIIPITVPAIVLVVGLAPVYSVVAQIFGSATWTLAFAYGVLVLPYAYRAIQSNLSAVDVVTLSEAARSLGAGWGTILFRIIVPNLRRGLLAASFISVAVVLGEYTLASLLNRTNLQTALVQVSKSDPYVAVIFSLLALAFAFVLLLVIGRLGAPRPRRRRAPGGQS
ncbi:ABC transporter permease [Compostimonas suwonensis]|uniref:Putative spermidine/putrescine transport system permease protein n=1 Tax=Compostimonas suwonensis TaxID=1048394 RepID=A0A2M9BW94_9MICO|nr:ABC transporter permease subunit [Compostimonas suwonensis]PJJ62205.1 putative spermidine/putrescine transport system permease protein [Compostimonas suwonensis]